MKIKLEPVIESNKDVSQGLTRIMTETSITINQAISDLNEKVLDFMNDKGMIAPYLTSSLVNQFETENRSKFKLKMIIFQIG